MFAAKLRNGKPSRVLPKDLQVREQKVGKAAEADADQVGRQSIAIEHLEQAGRDRVAADVRREAHEAGGDEPGPPAHAGLARQRAET